LLSYTALSFKKTKLLTWSIAIFIMFMALIIFSLKIGLSNQLIHYLCVEKFPFNDILLMELPSYAQSPVGSKAGNLTIIRFPSYYTISLP
jgi:hypothetical protein